MKKLLLILSVAAFTSCGKKEVANRCASCILINGQLWSYVCEDELDTLTIEEYVSYWDNAGDLVCEIKR